MPFEPRFEPLAGPESSRRFLVLHLPPDDRAPRGMVVHAAAFGEEMNKSRRMVAMQARALAGDGMAVLVPDLRGCGDSPGEHGDASWDDWVQDVCDGVAWLRAYCARHWSAPLECRLALWGLRAGALLACAAAARLEEPCDLLLWQPATQGRLVLQQFLRLLNAGDMLAGKAGHAASAARAELAAGRGVEVAGYGLSPALAAGLEAAELKPPPCPGRLQVLELAMQADAPLTPVCRNAVDRWRAAGWQVDAHVVAGPAFWQTTEIEDAPALVAASLGALGTWRDGAPIADHAGAREATA